jgi:hypothetical protein
MDGTRGYRDQEDHVQRGDNDRKHPGAFRDNIIGDERDRVKK